jgi:alkylation response protein AidB-like acyl-CoA dehydrogenase
VTANFDITLSEMGVDAASAIDELLQKMVNGRQIIDYSYATELPWTALGNTGWDLVGVAEEDGGAGIGIRDLIQIAKIIGRWVLPVPLTTSIVAKRWSASARESDGPVTVAVRTKSGRNVMPFGSYPEIRVLSGTGGSAGIVAPPASPSVDDYAPSLRLVEGAAATDFDHRAARELAIVWAAEAVGASERMLEIAVDYVKQREQFGQPVGRFQAVKHHLADALISIQEAESAVLWGAADAPRLAPALAIAFDSALRAAEICVQAHGGMGFTWELGLHVYLRHIVTLRLLALGLSEIADGA